MFGALNQNQAQLHNLITNSSDVFSATQKEKEALAATFRIFPTFLDESKATFAKLEGFSKNTDPLIRQLQPAIRDLRPTLVNTRALSPDLQHLFRNLDPLITASKTGLPALRDVLDGTGPVLGQLQPFLENLNPILQWLEYNQRLVGDFISNGAGALVDTVPVRDPNIEIGHYLRQFGPSGPETVAIYPNRADEQPRQRVPAADRLQRAGARAADDRAELRLQQHGAAAARRPRSSPTRAPTRPAGSRRRRPTRPGTPASSRTSPALDYSQAEPLTTEGSVPSVCT